MEQSPAVQLVTSWSVLVQQRLHAGGKQLELQLQPRLQPSNLLQGWIQPSVLLHPALRPEVALVPVVGQSQQEAEAEVNQVECL